MFFTNIATIYIRAIMPPHIRGVPILFSSTPGFRRLCAETRGYLIPPTSVGFRLRLRLRRDRLISARQWLAGRHPAAGAAKLSFLTCVR